MHVPFDGVLFSVFLGLGGALLRAGPGAGQSLKLAPSSSRPVTDHMLAKSDPADWLMWRRTHRSNVGKLRMLWTRGLGPGVQEGVPGVHQGVMYFPNPLDLMQAINAVTGDLVWEYRRKLPDDQRTYPLS
jgi:hypothetical protein